MMPRFLAIMCLLLATGAQSMETLEQLLTCAAANAPEKTYRQAMKVEVQQDGTVKREFLATVAIKGKGDQLDLNLAIQNPPEIAGTAVLMQNQRDMQSEVKIYFPAVRKVRSVSGDMSNQNMLGTDFSYSDIRLLYGDYSNGAATLIGEKKLGDRPVIAVQLAASDSEAASATVYIDKVSCVALKADYFDQHGELVKQLEGEIASLKSYGERHQITQYRMRDLVDGSETRLSLGEPKFDERIARAAFSASTFYKYLNSVRVPD